MNNMITMTDIRTRLSGLKTVRSSSNNSINESMRVACESNRLEDIKRYIREYSNYADQVPFYSFLKLFEAVIEKGNCSDINTMGLHITENVVPKVRDAKATNSLLKGRLTRMMHKASNPIKNAIQDAINNVKSTLPHPISTPPTSSMEDKKDAAVAEAYLRMLDKSTTMMHCDRVLENYNNISRRFNLDKIFVESSRTSSPGDITIDLCNKIDTYEIPTAIKFNSVIETAWYGFEYYAIPYKKSEILEAAVDYFLFKPDGLESCRDILESTLFFDKNEDMGNIDIFTEEEPESAESSIDESIRAAYADGSENTVSESTSFKKLFDKFKKEELPKDDKPQNKLKKLITMLYSKNVDDIINDTPDLLQWLRRFFIVGTCAIPAIGPVVMAIGFIVDRFISMKFERDEVSKMIKCFNNEIKAAKAKLKDSTDPQEKSRLEKYIKELEEGRTKLTMYHDNLLTEKEQEEEMDNTDNDDDDDFGFDDDDFDFDFSFDESFTDITKSIRTISTIIESKVITPASMYNLIAKVSDNDIENIAKSVARYPDQFYIEAVINSVENEIGKLSCNRNRSIAESIRMDSLISAKYKLHNSHNVKIQDAENILEAADNITALADFYSAFSIMIESYEYEGTMLEGSFTNRLRMASMKLRNAMTKLGDKERSISKSVDVGMNSFIKSVENSFTNDNRESIVRGSILPSFSKLLKFCIANIGVVALTGHPEIAAISTLGYIAINGRFKAKERQMIIDEIEIELQMCDKYINIAEQKNDMKALRQLLTTKRELERQRQRIKYKMKVNFGQKYYDADSNGIVDK